MERGWEVVTKKHMFLFYLALWGKLYHLQTEYLFDLDRYVQRSHVDIYNGQKNYQLIFLLSLPKKHHLLFHLF